MSPSAIAAVESVLGYIFVDKSLLIRALTSKGYVNEQRQRGNICWDQSAYRVLGDRVLSLILTELLMNNGYATGGAISLKKQTLESRKYLSQFPQAVAIAPYMRLGKGEQKQKTNQQLNTIAETFEAVIAAIYQDGGHEVTRKLIWRWFAEGV